VDHVGDDLSFRFSSFTGTTASFGYVEATQLYSADITVMPTTAGTYTLDLILEGTTVIVTETVVIVAGDASGADVSPDRMKAGTETNVFLTLHDAYDNTFPTSREHSVGVLFSEDMGSEPTTLTHNSS
ncbi:hypothetical protein KIPB_016682, partial [Kipferlia bialata]